MPEGDAVADRVERQYDEAMARGVPCVMSGGDVAIAASRHRLDERRPGGIVAEGGAHPFDGGVEAVLEVDEGAVWPETVAQFVSSDEVSRALEQRAQDFERLTLKLEARRADSQLAGAQVELERSDLHWIRWYHTCGKHSVLPQ